MRRSNRNKHTRFYACFGKQKIRLPMIRNQNNFLGRCFQSKIVGCAVVDSSFFAIVAF